MIGEARQKVDGYAADLAVLLNQVRLACGSPAKFAVILVAHCIRGLPSYLHTRSGAHLSAARVPAVK